MPSMSAANSGNSTCMPGRGEPVVHRRANAAPLDWRVSRACVAGNQQQHPLAGIDRLLERVVDRCPRSIEIVAMKVEDTVRFNRSGLQFSVPGPVQRRREAAWPLSGGHRTACHRPSLRRSDAWRLCRWFARIGFHSARQRPNCRGYPSPEPLFVRAERAHGPRRPWAAGSEPARRPTCPRRSAWPLLLPPRTYRTGWVL